VVLEGTTGIIEGDGPRMHARASVRVRVLPPLPPESLGNDEVALAARVRALFFEALGLPPLVEESRNEDTRQSA
jgi:1-acyl-sn-glycerol-3-phosphate acyltransferase